MTHVSLIYKFSRQASITPLRLKSKCIEFCCLAWQKVCKIQQFKKKKKNVTTDTQKNANKTEWKRDFELHIIIMWIYVCAWKKSLFCFGFIGQHLDIPIKRKTHVNLFNFFFSSNAFWCCYKNTTWFATLPIYFIAIFYGNFLFNY